MNTKERLKKQRRAASGMGWPIGVGVGIGLSVVIGTSFTGGENVLTPEWAIYLIAYGLGGATVRAVWWLRGYETPPVRKKKESE